MYLHATKRFKINTIIKSIHRFRLLLMCYCHIIYVSRLPFAPKTQADLQEVSKSEVTTPSAEKISQTGEFEWMRDSIYQDDNSVKTSEERSTDILQTCFVLFLVEKE